MVLSDGSVRNAFSVKLRNMESRPRDVKVALSGVPQAMMWSDDMARNAAARSLRRTIPADQAQTVRVYVTSPAGTASQDFDFAVRALDAEGGEDTHQTHFDVPGDAP